tara:strand:- start:22 stop:396 length:375 start_codon:yes stop_codon:yes gene_type:complete
MSQFSCSKDLLINCKSGNYYQSTFYKSNNGFLNSQREISTKLSENDFDIILSDYNLSCKDILANYFYCNFCFNSSESFIISYDGRKIILEDSTEAIEFTKNVLSIISNMQMGSEEYDEFISTRP